MLASARELRNTSVVMFAFRHDSRRGVLRGYEVSAVLLTLLACSGSPAPSPDAAMVPAAAGASGATAGGGSEALGSGGVPAGAGGASPLASGGALGAGAPAMGGSAGGTSALLGSSGSGGGLTIPGLSATSPLSCVPTGQVSYTLVTGSAPTASEQLAFKLITTAMNLAVAYYNCHTPIQRTISVYYDPTFEVIGGGDGIIRFGSIDSMNPVTAMHEIARVLGVGSDAYAARVKNGVFTGENATRELRAITQDPNAVVKATAKTFSPYGLNYLAEVTSLEDLVRHCRMVAAILRDLTS